MKNIKIFIGFSEVAGYNSNLQKGFNALGIENDLITFGTHKFKYENDLNRSYIQRYIQYIASKYIGKNIFFMFLHTINKIVIFIFALFKYDVFIFSHHGSFLNFYDLPILKFFKKKIIYKFFGSDIRAPYINGGYFYGDELCHDTIENMTKNIYLKNKKVIKYADYIINNPAASHLLPREQINTFSIGFPMEINLNNEFIKEANVITILHAPSLKKQKGSDVIKLIIDELKKEGYNIQFIEIFNMPNSEVIKKLQICDFIIDEIFSDSPMAAFCTEAAYCGKPAIIGGYYDNMKEEFGVNELPPSLYVNPLNIKDAVIKLIEDKDFRISLGEKAHKFVLKHNSPINVAKRYLKLINNEPEVNWIFNPNKISYIYGWGTSKNRLKEFLRDYVEDKGESALYLNHNPKLKQRFLDFINE